jgi:outer membrane DcaP-like protein
MTEHKERAPGPRRSRATGVRWLAGVAALLVALTGTARAQAPAQQAGPSLEVYGFAMLDMGHDFKTIAPAWFDTMRVTKLPSFDGQYGEDHNTFAGVRQSRLGVRTSSPTALGELKTTFEFELFGVGVDEGQTTFRLRHAYGELGAFGAGQYWSPFMDPNVFPNSLEYWGPTGMVFFRNVQFRWMPVRGDTNVTIALERPGASGDPGTLANRIELQNIRGRFPVPDLSAQVTVGRAWGYGRVAGILRRISWDDTLNDQFDLSDSVTGWGLNFSSVLNMRAKKDVVRLQLVIGEGIQNYMNDSPVDVGIEANTGDPVRPIEGEPLGILGIVAFLDHNWTDRWSTTIGYSRQDIDNSALQVPDAFKTGQYALGNLLFTPVPNVMVGGEFQWGRRENFSDGFTSDGYKLQFSFKYNFSYKVGG